MIPKGTIFAEVGNRLFQSLYFISESRILFQAIIKGDECYSFAQPLSWLQYKINFSKNPSQGSTNEEIWSLRCQDLHSRSLPSAFAIPYHMPAQYPWLQSCDLCLKWNIPKFLNSQNYFSPAQAMLEQDMNIISLKLYHFLPFNPSNILADFQWTSGSDVLTF